MTTRNWTPFIAGSAHWLRNAGSVAVREAILNTNTGERVTGIYIMHAGQWSVMPDANAIQMANDILDTIETRTLGTAGQDNK